MEKNKILKIIACQVGGSFYNIPESEKYYCQLNENVKNSGGWWYLHGQLQEEIGYDKGLILNIEPEEMNSTQTDIALEGIYQVEVEGIEKPCIGYFWIDSLKLGRGLVCYKNDLESVEYARNKYQQKSDRL